MGVPKQSHSKWGARLRRLLASGEIETDDPKTSASSVQYDGGQEGHGSPWRTPNETIYDNAERSSTTEHLGLFQITVENAETTVDIVAVHGLGGDYRKTWTWNPAKPNESNPFNWLESLLPNEFPHARIMSFGYNSAVAYSKSIGDISTFAEQLLQMLSRERVLNEQKHRPIIFICHSLGGIVVKKMLNLANERRRLRDFDAALLESVKGIIFMGTPHRGSKTADLGSIGAKMLEAASLGRTTNAELIKQLRQGTRVLQELSSSFILIAMEFPIWTFIESDRMDGLSEPIVTEDSARLNMPNEQFCPLNGNHINMCKFNGRTENYKMVAHAIGELIGASINNLSKYLSDIELIAAHPSRQLQSGAAEIERFGKEHFVWFFESPEFAHWMSYGSQMLHLSGKPKSGKTSLSRCLWNHLDRGRTYNSCQDIVIHFISISTSTDELPNHQIAHILFSLIVHLLKSDRKRLGTVASQFPLQELSSSHISPSLHINHIWKFLFASIIAVPDRQVIIIIDALDEIRNDEITESRRTFLRNLLKLKADVSNTEVDLKIFLSSRPHDDVDTELSSVPCIEIDKEQKECLRSLYFDEFSARRDRVEKAHPESGKWLTSDNNYQNWESRHQSSLLLIRGKPGSGKSTLVKSILDSISSQPTTQTDVGNVARSMNDDVLIASFFYSFRGGMKETSHAFMLQSLLYQLLDQDESLFPLFRGVYRAKRADPKFQWQKEDLERIFVALPSLMNRKKIYIFLDAMDESAEKGRPEIIGILQRLCATKSNCIFKCLIASRPLLDGQIDNSAHYCIDLQEKNRSDIESLIKSGLQHIIKMAGGGAIDPKLAYDHMASNAHGVFLWVSLVLKELERLAASGASREDVESCLLTLPLDLEEMYERIIQRLMNQSPNRINQAAKMLTWVTFARRPLTIEEFHDAVVIPSYPKPFIPRLDFMERARIFGFEKRLQVCCGPLLEVRQSSVQLLHQTLREYLVRKDRRATPFDTDEERGDTEIASVCIRYLSLLCPLPCPEPIVTWNCMDYDNFTKWLAGYPLLLHAVLFLPRHLAGLTEKSPVFEELSTLLGELQKQDASNCLFEVWIRSLDRSASAFLQSGMSPGQFRAKCLVGAVRSGHTEVVQLLLDLQADMNYKDEENGSNPLHVAVDTGKGGMVAFLLSTNANINSKDKKGQTPLLRAVELGHEEIVKLLLDAGVSADAPGLDRGNALQLAVLGGHERIVRLLIDSGASVNACGEYNALQLAVSAGNQEIVQLLIDYGANVNTCVGLDAFQLAVSADNEHIARLLIDSGAHVNSGGSYNTLQLAVSAGHEATVRLLIRSGANVNAGGGCNALQLAVSGGNQHMVQLLIDSGADVNASGCRNTLEIAMNRSKEGIARLLIDSGANLNVRCGSNALKSAVSGDNQHMARLLLDYGADVNSYSGEHGSPLELAASGGHQQMVRLLIDSGADVNGSGGDHGKSLGSVPRKCYRETFRRLFGEEVDVNPHPSGLYGNPLRIAASRGDQEMIQLLIDLGANVNAQSEGHSTALRTAMIKDHQEIVQMLLDRGADPNI